MRRFVETNGESLRQGWEYFQRDLKPRTSRWSSRMPSR
jgi:polyhydroxyalkanoate synthase